MYVPLFCSFPFPFLFVFHFFHFPTFPPPLLSFPYLFMTFSLDSPAPFFYSFLCLFLCSAAFISALPTSTSILCPAQWLKNPSETRPKLGRLLHSESAQHACHLLPVQYCTRDGFFDIGLLVPFNFESFAKLEPHFGFSHLHCDRSR